MTTLVWSDEFAVAGAPDPAKWNLADNSWNAPKGEAQAYTSRAKNVVVDAWGRLKIDAYKEDWTPPPGGGGAMHYTSARLDTLGKFAFTQGRLEASIRTPQNGATGFWPAFWTRGVAGSWPAGGEIDIMEEIDNVPWISNGVHAADNAGAHWTANHLTSVLPEFRSGYHLYTLDRAADKLTFSVDRVVTWELQRSAVPTAAQPALFDAPHYVIVNLAIDGWASTPDATTTFNNQMYVEYVRAYAP